MQACWGRGKDIDVGMNNIGQVFITDPYKQSSYQLVYYWYRLNESPIRGPCFALMKIKKQPKKKITLKIIMYSSMFGLKSF
jgi:hypothetical protein